MARVEVRPESFALVRYDAARIATITEELAQASGFPADVELLVDIDEELPLPLTGSTVDLVDGRAVLWFSGANFENGQHRCTFDEPTARTELAISVLRAGDRLRPEFAGAPPDDELADNLRHAWDTWAEGRAARMGERTRIVRRQYCFRLYNGFTDVADAAFDRLWTADGLTLADLEALSADCAAADTRPRPTKRAPIRRESLKAR